MVSGKWRSISRSLLQARPFGERRKPTLLGHKKVLSVTENCTEDSHAGWFYEGVTDKFGRKLLQGNAKQSKCIKGDAP